MPGRLGGVSARGTRPADDAGRADGAPGPAGAGPPDRARVAARAPVLLRPAAPLDRSLGYVVLLALAAFVVPLLGPSLALHGTGEVAAPGAGGIAVLRTVLCAALCVPVGEAYAGWLARRVPGAPVRPPPSRAVPAAAAGFLAALGLACVVAAGNLIPHRLADLDTAGLYRTRDGVLALVEVNAFLLALLWARTRYPVCRLVPPAAVVAAEALRAHPNTESWPLFGSALTAVHLTCAVLWLGGLWQVLRTVRLWRASDGDGTAAGAGSANGAALLAAYARRAAILLAALALTGAMSTVRRMPPATLLDQLVTTAYGRALLAKLVLVTGVCALALTARFRLAAALPRALPRPGSSARLHDQPRTGDPPDPRDPLTACAPARAEVAVLGVVVAVSALLTALPVPIRW